MKHNNGAVMKAQVSAEHPGLKTDGEACGDTLSVCIRVGAEVSRLLASTIAAHSGVASATDSQCATLRESRRDGERVTTTRTS